MTLVCLVFNCARLEDLSVPEAVSRRLSGDFAFFGSGHIVCSLGYNLTYLVEDRQCVSNEELFDGRTL